VCMDATSTVSSPLDGCDGNRLYEESTSDRLVIFIAVRGDLGAYP
jgi:hypothetical protein